MSIIGKKEGKETVNLTRQFLVNTQHILPKPLRKTGWCLLGLKDSISEKEERILLKN